MQSLLELIESHIPADVIHQAASQFGETPDAIQSAVGGLIPAMLGGIVQKAESSAEALDGLFGQLTSGPVEGFLDNLGGLVTGGNLAQNDPKDIAGALLGSLFGAKVPQLLSSIVSLAGLKSLGSASGLLGLVGPVVMGVLGKKIAGEGLSVAGLGALFAKEKDGILAAIPAGLATTLGLGAVVAPVAQAAPAPAPQPAPAATSAPKPAPAAAPTAAAEPARGGGLGWLWPVLILGALAALAWWFLKPNAAPVATVETPVVEAPVAETPVAVAPIVDTPPPVTDGFARDLNGVQLTGATGGVEEKLIAFIESGREPCTEKDCWFSMDRLVFKTGSAELDLAVSSEQLNNVFQIMTAFPTIQLKVGGYTDNVGDPANNLALSQARAEAVVAYFGARGIPAERFSAEGYGDQHPIADNATPEGRAMNRRIDVRVRQR